MSHGEAVAQTHKQSLIDLSRLLSRLEYTLSPQNALSWRSSPYSRKKVSSNIEHARTLLLRLEHSSSNLRVSTQNGLLQPDLQKKRILLKKLQDRFYDLSNVEDDSDEEGASDNGDEEDLLAKYAPQSSTKPEATGSKAAGPDVVTKLYPTSTTSAMTSEPTLRARSTATVAGQDTAASSGSAYGQRPNHAPSTDERGDQRPSSEKLLSHHTAEQEGLSASLLNLATQLKESSLLFQDTLAQSNPLVDRASTALDRNTDSMGAAEKRMGMLRRMTEGRGWYGRLMLYGFIAGLYILLILIWIVVPKLRL